MGGTYVSLNYHIIFSTKKRERYISETIRQRLYDYIGGTIKNQNGVLSAIGGASDHVHLFVSWCPDISISNLARDIKSASSGWLHKEYPDMSQFSWQEGYGAFSVSPSQTDKLRSYILNQDKHHSKTDFKTEFRALLEAHGVTINEKYIWK